MIHTIIETSTDPRFAVPTVTGGAMANIIGHLPDFINICMTIYVVLLVAHKIWVMWDKYKTGVDDKDGD